MESWTPTGVGGLITIVCFALGQLINIWWTAKTASYAAKAASQSTLAVDNSLKNTQQIVEVKELGKQTHDLVNSQTEELKKALEEKLRIAVEEVVKLRGEARGRADEKADAALAAGVAAIEK